MGLEQVYRNNVRKLKGFWFKLYLEIHGCKVGSGLKCYSFPNIRAISKDNITIGNNVTFGFNCTLEITKKGKLLVGDDVNITQNVLISSNAAISIGESTLIGENVSIRDTDHNTKKGIKIQLQEMISEPITIKNDVWVAANSIVLRGSVIEKGVVIGANSLVHRKSKLEADKIYVGSPVKFVKDRI
jgi:acetyltransferase-like isoleucine patch superfamily enzyme